MSFAVVAMSPQHLALLKAILANPEDDLPRLVFADWLEENGTTDADAARVEFIRLGCKSKAKIAVSPKEGEWLDENWRRLLVNTLSVTDPADEECDWRRKGRHVWVTIPWMDQEWTQRAVMVFSFMRGFALRVEYRTRLDYRTFWQRAATDEPLAYHRPERLAANPRSSTPSTTQPNCVLFAQDWGEAVFNRVIGFDSQPVSSEKHFTGFRYLTSEERSEMDKSAVQGDHFPAPHYRLRDAVATAMTALAREFVGLTDSCEKG